jgi:hypothetical protein
VLCLAANGEISGSQPPSRASNLTFVKTVTGQLLSNPKQPFGTFVHDDLKKLNFDRTSYEHASCVLVEDKCVY